MTNTKELSVEDKLRAIYDLQLIDSRIDEIRNVRGELPLEVEDLEDEVAGLSTRAEKLKGELEVAEENIKVKKAYSNWSKLFLVQLTYLVFTTIKIIYML